MIAVRASGSVLGPFRRREGEEHKDALNVTFIRKNKHIMLTYRYAMRIAQAV